MERIKARAGQIAFFEAHRSLLSRATNYWKF